MIENKIIMKLFRDLNCYISKGGNRVDLNKLKSGDTETTSEFVKQFMMTSIYMYLNSY
jgi:hypothetical protein